jgi:hypothetical protein
MKKTRFPENYEKWMKQAKTISDFEVSNYLIKLCSEFYNWFWKFIFGTSNITNNFAKLNAASNTLFSDNLIPLFTMKSGHFWHYWQSLDISFLYYCGHGILDDLSFDWHKNVKLALGATNLIFDFLLTCQK